MQVTNEDQSKSLKREIQKQHTNGSSEETFTKLKHTDFTTNSISENNLNLTSLVTT